MSLWWPESFDELFGVLPDSSILREESETRECHFTSSQTPLWETVKHVSNASGIIHVECSRALQPLSLSFSLYLKTNLFPTFRNKHLNAQLYLEDHPKCSFPARWGVFMMINKCKLVCMYFVSSLSVPCSLDGRWRDRDSIHLGWMKEMWLGRMKFTCLWRWLNSVRRVKGITELNRSFYIMQPRYSKQEAVQCVVLFFIWKLTITWHHFDCTTIHLWFVFKDWCLWKEPVDLRPSATYTVVMSESPWKRSNAMLFMV